MDDRRKKILCVSNTSFFLYNFAQGLLKTLRTEGFQVVAVAPRDHFSERLEQEGFPVIRLQQLDRKSSNPIQDARLLRELFRIYRREQPELCLHFTIKLNVYGGLAARFAKTRSIATVTGLGWLFTERNLKARLGAAGYKVLYRIAFSKCDKVFFLNRDDLGIFIRSQLLSHAKAGVLPGSGVNTDRYSLAAISEQAPTHSGVRFLLMARMLWDKGVREFVEAADMVRQRYPDAEFTLLGPIDGDNRSGIPLDRIKDWEAKKIIRYAGSTDDVRPYLAASDAVVLPSFYREGVPGSLLEAMSMERPVITTDNVGCRETVEEGKNGYIVPAKDAVALAGACMKLIEASPEERARMGQYGRKKVLKEFDERIVVDAYMNAVRDALRSAERDSPLIV
jgi:glycosyltransferase involved in cell wall biosynthesis